MSLIPTFSAHNGYTLDQVGFGTYLLNGQAGVDTMVSAAKAGYRLFDSAVNYENEGALGRAVARIVAEGVATRDQLEIVSKLPGRHHTFNQALYTIEESLYRTSLDAYDLYLIHWPNPLEDKYVEAWTALIEAQKRGYVKQIGVCNFLPVHLDRLKDETGVVPVVNQVELHPYFPQLEQLAYDREHGIITQAWSPLGRANKVLQEPVIVEIAQRHGKSVAQVILRWATQLGAMPIPKSTLPARQAENIALFDFELEPQEIAAISALGKPDGRSKAQDPSIHQEF